MDEELRQLVSDLSTRPPGDVEALAAAAGAHGVELPDDYLELMEATDGALGAVGEHYIELWPVQEVLETALGETPYEGVLLFAGDGANTVYGFDGRSAGEIVEGDWIGLGRDELIAHGRTLTELLQNLAADRVEDADG
jgi:hypothetical protein